MGKLNKELHEALENLDGKEFTRGASVGKTLKNFNSIHIIAVVTFTKTTEGSTVVVKDINGDDVTVETNGTYKLHEETYTVTNSKAGYFSKTTTIEVEQADITAGTKAVTLEALEKYCVVTFAVKDSESDANIEDAVIVVNDGEDIVTAESDGTYKLVAGTYTYGVTASGYTPQTAQELVISSGEVTTGTKAVSVALVEVAD